ncbi:nuclease-related domain-containing protein [Peribacillus acanthi]|uniref:nuclease-related domain-containing protein n=1 Tax=Peribacillus acanthi TaxID=2171554 RepID=UPI000D3E0C2F|nr:nuclease-related domain-containing protein [Peribacillus acanthi]
MIIKDLKVPISIHFLEALLRRLPPFHPKIPYLKEELNIRQAGYAGEIAMTFPLSFLDPKNYHIFRGIRLFDEKYHFQLDILVLSKQFILILEVKNYGGIIYFDPVFNQLIQTKEEKERSFPDPLIQAQRHKSQFTKWLATNGFSEIPIFPLVIISNPRTIIRTSPDNNSISNKVIHRDILPSKIKHFEKSNPLTRFSEKEIKKIIRLINKQHTEGESSIIEHYQIIKSDLQKGVFCPECNYLPTLRRHGTWYCPKCRSKNKDAHINALNDYKLLIGSTITNSELRDFFILESPAAASRLLQSLNLPFTGTFKNRVHKLSFKD